VAQQFFENCIPELRQGDVLEKLPFLSLSKEGTAKSTTQEKLAFLLNHSCDIDKEYPKLVVVPVIPLKSVDASTQSLIKKNRILAYLYLPAFQHVIEDSFVSFLEPMTVEMAIVKNARRIVSLSDEGRRALYVQYTRWLSRWQLTEIPCPNCGVSFNPASTLRVENG